MGTYLATGIVQKMSISRKEIERNKFPFNNIVESLRKKINLEHYIFGENDTTLFWQIKPEMLEGNFAMFLQAQFKMYNDRANIDEVLKGLAQAQSGNAIIEIVKSGSLGSNLQMVENIMDYLQAEDENRFSKHILVYYQMIAFFIDGKIIMECYNNIFSYFENNIRLQQAQYPVAACVRTMITS